MNKILERQGLHLLAYLLLTVVVAVATFELGTGDEELWGLTATGWITLSWLFAGISQLWVALFWRLELYGGHVSARFGRAGFTIHKVGYVLTFALRLAPLLPMAVLTARTLPVPASVTIPMLVVSTPPIVWALWGGAVYLGLDRLAGADHFDPRYRTMGKETRGVYAYVPNAAYVLGVLFLFHPGLLFQSALGLVVATAHWAMVWVHYYCTERPDLVEIYGGKSSPPSGWSKLASTA